MAAKPTSIKSYGVIESKPLEIYGIGEVILRVGNGGAGATGLLGALANDYLASDSRNGSISWVCNHSRNTQLALLHGYIDVALTYERDLEDLAIAEGWSSNSGCVFHDHFCVAGPASDPAGVRSAFSIEDAFKRIATRRSLFHSRADDSATMWKERSIWSLCNLSPWEDAASAIWYKKSTYNPAEALIQADNAGAYLLTDRSTLLRQTALETISNSTVFIEPNNKYDVLMNSCYALYSPSPCKHVAKEEVSAFLAYLKSLRAQEIIAELGKGVTGFPYFATLEQGFARSVLVGGRPENGKWVVD